MVVCYTHSICIMLLYPFAKAILSRFFARSLSCHLPRTEADQSCWVHCTCKKKKITTAKETNKKNIFQTNEGWSSIQNSQKRQCLSPSSQVFWGKFIEIFRINLINEFFFAINYHWKSLQLLAKYLLFIPLCSEINSKILRRTVGKFLDYVS